MALQQVLLEDGALGVGEEKRLLPGLDVADFDRLHFHIGAKAVGIPGLSVRILFATPIRGGALLTDSTIWFENADTEVEFSHATPSTYTGTGFVMSVPVIAPRLYDVILVNKGSRDLTSLYVTLLAR